MLYYLQGRSTCSSNTFILEVYCNCIKEKKKLFQIAFVYEYFNIEASNIVEVNFEIMKLFTNNKDILFEDKIELNTRNEQNKTRGK